MEPEVPESPEQSLFDQAVSRIRQFAGDGSRRSDRPATLDLNPPPYESEDGWSWAPQPKQQLAMGSRADEIYYGGARGGGKTNLQIYWLMRPCIERYNNRYKYTNFKGSVMRLQYADLTDWITDAEEIYGHYGGIPTGQVVVFTFPSGSIITTGHMQEKEGLGKKHGHSVHALAIDEVNQISDRNKYVKIFGSLRGSPTGLSQALLTGNPGGPGDAWVSERFINVYAKGVKIPWGTMFMDPQSGMTRVFIQSQLRDNPILLRKDPGYLLKLLAQDEVTRRQWLDGDWDVSPGSYFTEFRRTQSPYEPHGAYHCVHSSRVSIKRWFRKWISIDWGFDDYAAVYWYCQNDKGRVYVYREYVARRVGSFQLGVDIARQTLEDLPDSDDLIMDAFVSPDLFNKTDQGSTRATELARGISMVLGFGTAVAMGYDNDEKEIADKDPGKAYELYTARVISTLQTARIALKMANNRRVEGLQFMREMLRWRPIDQMEGVERQYEALMRTGDKKHIRLAKNYEAMLKVDSVLPKVRILSDRCPRLIETITKCRTNPDKLNDMLEFKGDDPVDSFRYGLLGYRDLPAELPRKFVIAAAIDAAVEQQAKSGQSDRFGLRMKYLAACKEFDRSQARKELEETEDVEIMQDIESNLNLEDIGENDIASRYGIVL